MEKQGDKLMNKYIIIPLDEYKELQDLYQKLSETEEQRKNMSQAYEDEYQTRLALQEEIKRLKALIKRNLNHCTSIKIPLN